jgi:hypothetical protein
MSISKFSLVLSVSWVLGVAAYLFAATQQVLPPMAELLTGALLVCPCLVVVMSVVAMLKEPGQRAVAFVSLLFNLLLLPFVLPLLLGRG